MALSEEELDQAVHELASRVLDLMGQRLNFGSLTLHFHEGKVARVEFSTSYRPERRSSPRFGVDTRGG